MRLWQLCDMPLGLSGAIPWLIEHLASVLRLKRWGLSAEHRVSYCLMTSQPNAVSETKE